VHLGRRALAVLRLLRRVVLVLRRVLRHEVVCRRRRLRRLRLRRLRLRLLHRRRRPRTVDVDQHALLVRLRGHVRDLRRQARPRVVTLGRAHASRALPWHASRA